MLLKLCKCWHLLKARHFSSNSLAPRAFPNWIALPYDSWAADAIFRRKVVHFYCFKTLMDGSRKAREMHADAPPSLKSRSIKHMEKETICQEQVDLLTQDITSVHLLAFAYVVLPWAAYCSQYLTYVLDPEVYVSASFFSNLKTL